MKASEAHRLAEGELDRESLEPGERVLFDLTRKSVLAPATLGPEDLVPVAAHFGRSGALEIVSMVGSFHFINRIADLVGIQSDLPVVQPRWAGPRKWGVRFQGFLMGRFLDLSNRDVGEVDVAACLSDAERLLGPLPAGWQDLHEAPNVAAFLTTVTAVLSRIDPALTTRIRAAVASALPADEDAATGFHPRPHDPVDALAFVGTRYAVRVTDRMVTAVREKTGHGDPELTDLFYLVGMANAFERMNRLLAAPLP